MAGVTATIDVVIDARLIGATRFGTAVAPVRVAKHIGINPGSAALGQDDILWADTRTLAASATENLDLNGVISGLLGATVAAVQITGIYLEAAAGNTNNVVFFGAASNAFSGPLSGTTPALALGPGDCALITNNKGWAVTPGTGDIILVTNGGAGTGVSYNIVILGRSVAV